MQTEIEAKFLDADHDEIRGKLKKLGAVRTHERRLMHRKNFDYPDHRLEKVGGWVRVRDEGDQVTLSYKQLNDRSLHGTKEVSLIVDGFDSACKLLEAIGLKSYSYQETKRETWELDGAQVELDEWPWVKPYVEIETPDEKTLKNIASKLGLEWSEAKHGSVEIVYQAEYDFTEAEIDAWPEITFIDPPDWLLANRNKQWSG